MSQAVPVAVTYGDGIGPEIMSAVLEVLQAAGTRLEYRVMEVGEKVYRQGESSGIGADAWRTLREAKVFLKAPITTPQGGGYKSLNVTMRKSLGLYANVRPCVSYAPFVLTRHPMMDLVIIRENEEDTYAGIEHRQSGEVYQCLKLVSVPGCEKIIRYAFDYARRSGRRKVTCMSKDNIMKMTDGLFHKIFDQVAGEYADLQNEHLIIDIGTALLADQPENFDVIVTLNLYGDIISDVAAELAGSVGMAGSANIGQDCAMFEAIHGSAPSIAGKNVANPSGLLQAAVMMLVHLDQADTAQQIHNAWLRTIEDGLHTYDIFTEGRSRSPVGTKQFAQAVIERLGMKPERLHAVQYRHSRPTPHMPVSAARAVKALQGVDVFLDWDEAGRDADILGRKVEPLASPDLQLRMITNRGVKVYPQGLPETFRTDHWRCRFVAANGTQVNHEQIVALLSRLAAAGLDFIKTEHLYSFDGQPGYSLGQGE